MVSKPSNRRLTMYDHLDTMENWRKVTNTELQAGDKAHLLDGTPVIVMGFGPYFLWVRREDRADEFRTTKLKELEDL